MKKAIILFTFLFLVRVNLYSQFQNVRVSDPNNTNRPNEVTIAINPVDQNYIAAGSNLRFYYVSSNGGLTWQETIMDSPLGVWGDPVVIYDPLGNLFYGHLSDPPSPGHWIDRIVVQKSTNNGTTWNDGAGIGYSPSPKAQDKEWLIADFTNSPYQNNIYVSWTEFDSYGSSSSSDSSRILFSRSTDHGETWAIPIKISDVGGDCIDSDNTTEGAVPAVGPNGEVYVSWAGPLGIMFDKSTDGGVTFGTDIFVTDQPGGWDYDVPGINRCNGLPVTVCDISSSQYSGNIYINWTDQRNGLDNTDVFVIKSTDGGATWGTPVKVNDDNTSRHQFFTWMTVDQTSGYLYVVFYDRRNTTGAVTDVYLARSIDGGETFQNFKINETSFSPVSSIFFGDYTCIAAMDGKIFPIWMRMDEPQMSIWTALINDNILPVELTSFTAELTGDILQLRWTTATEVNNYGFEIERKVIYSTGEGEWGTVGFVNGNGNSSSPSSYQFEYQLYNNPALTILFRLKQIDFDGSFVYSPETSVRISNPKNYFLYQNYPNPFNPSTVIGYRIPEKSFVNLTVYDVLGNEISILVNETKEPGSYEVNFDASGLSSGIYIYKITAGSFQENKKMILLR